MSWGIFFGTYRPWGLCHLHPLNPLEGTMWLLKTTQNPPIDRPVDHGRPTPSGWTGRASSRWTRAPHVGRLGGSCEAFTHHTEEMTDESTRRRRVLCFWSVWFLARDRFFRHVMLGA